MTETPARLVAELQHDLPSLIERVAASVSTAEQEFVDLVLTPEEIGEMVAVGMAATLDALAGGEIQTEAAWAVGPLKVERGVPLDNVIHGYRLGGLALWEAILERARPAEQAALPALSTRLWSVVEAYSTATTEGYRAAELTRDSVPPARLVEAIVNPAWGSAARGALRGRLGLPVPGVYVVVVSRAAVTLRHHGRTATSVGSVAGTVHITLAGLPEGSSGFVEVAGAAAGVSRPFSDLDDAPAALEEAKLALRGVAADDDATVLRYGESPSLLLLAAGPAVGRQASSALLAPVDALGAADRDDLLATARAWFECEGSTARIGQVLHVHRNTALHRLKRLEELLGLSFKDPRSTAELWVALEGRRLLG